MNWSRMRKLDLDLPQTCPINLFSVIIGHTPHLKSLCFRFPREEEPADAIYRYLESINGLESLDVANAKEYLTDLWPALKNHQRTLKRLVIRPTISGYGFPIHIDLEALRPLARDFPNIEHLDIPIPFGNSELASGAQAMVHPHIFITPPTKTTYLIDLSSSKTPT